MIFFSKSTFFISDKNILNMYTSVLYIEFTRQGFQQKTKSDSLKVPVHIPDMAPDSNDHLCVCIWLSQQKHYQIFSSCYTLPLLNFTVLIRN